MTIAETTAGQMSGAHALVAALELEGVRHFFGVPGHGAYPIYDALNDFPAITPVVGRNEQGSFFTADGYARATDDVAVVTSVPLAGVTNAATSIWEANGHGSRVLYLIEEDPMHEAFLRPIVRHYRHAHRVADIAPAVHDLFHALRTGRPGVAVLEVPNGVLHARAVADPADGLGSRRPPRLDEAGIDEAVRLLSEARRPAICADGYTWGRAASGALTRIAEKLRAPVLIGSMSKGALPDDHPLCLGMNWNVKGHAGRMLAEADVVLGIGARDGMISGARSSQVLAQQLIHVDWDGSQQGSKYPARLHLNGPIASILDRIAERVQPRSASGWPSETLEAVRDAVAAYGRGYCPWVFPVLAAIREALPRDAMLCTDSLIGLWAQRLFPAYAPATVHFPWATGTLGHGVSAGVGMALADPSRTIACLGGDGAFLYNSQELAAMMHYRRKLIVIVANDSCFSAIKFNLTNNFGRAIAYELTNPDFVKLGEAYGMRAVRLSSPDEIGTAVRDAVAADRSTLIDLPLQVLPPHP